MENENTKFGSFQDFFFQAVEEKMPVDTALNKERVVAKTQELIEANRVLVQDQPSAEHLLLTCTVIACFFELRKILATERCLLIIKYAFVDSLSFITRETRALLDASEDPFREIVAISKQKEKAYGETFEFYRKQDDGHAYLLEVKKCFYCNVLKSNGSQELMPIFCDFDTNWMNAIDPKKHGFRFDRPGTIGTGGNICKFYFTKIDGI